MPLSDHQTRHNLNKKNKFPSVKSRSFTRNSHIMFVCFQNIRVSLNYSQIRARDSSAYPSVSTQSHLLMCKSLRLGVCSEVYVMTVHDRALLTGLLFGKECSPATAPSTRLHTMSRLYALCEVTECHSDSLFTLAYYIRPYRWERSARTSGIATSCWPAYGAVKCSCGPSCVLQALYFVLKCPCPLLQSQEQGKNLFLSRSNA